MNPLENILQYAHDRGIQIHPYPAAGAFAMAFEVADQPAVVIDMDGIEDPAEQAVVIAHEIGHIETGTLRDDDVGFTPTSKDEYQAEQWAIQKMLPEGRLEVAMVKCQGHIWEMAEELDLSEPFVKKAIKYYGLKG